MAPKQFEMEGKKNVNKIKIKLKGAIEEQPSCERKLDLIDVSSGDITSRPGSVSSHDLVLCEFHERFILFCEFCVKDLFVLLPDLLLVVFKQPLTQVAHLLQCKRRLVLP